MATLTRLAQLEVLHFEDLEAAGVTALVTTRQGGTSTGVYQSLNLGLHVGDSPEAVLANRRLVARTMGLHPSDLVVMDQVHGARVALVGPNEAGLGVWELDEAITATDALVTTTEGLGLVVLVADCVPVLLCDPVARVLAVAHAGWRGTAAGVLEATVEAMEACGADRARLLVKVGPGVDQARFEVGEEVVEALGPLVEPFVDRSGPKPHVDLMGHVVDRLERAGIPLGSIEASGYSTAEAGLFFSDRAARPCGRFALVAVLRPAGPLSEAPYHEGPMIEGAP